VVIIDLWPYGSARGLRNSACEGIALVCSAEHHTWGVV
jgi:hypothetical protein